MTRGSLCTSNQFAHASFFSHGLEERYVQIRSICPILTNCMLDDFLIALMWLAAGSYHLFDKLFSILRIIRKAIFILFYDYFSKTKISYFSLTFN